MPTRRFLAGFGRGSLTHKPLHYQGPCSALAIAADSMVDAVDVYPDGRISIDKRIRVSVDRPWLGEVILENARLLPVRRTSFGTPTLEANDWSTSIAGFEKHATWPYLALDIFGPREAPNNLFAIRAPEEFAWHQTAGTGATICLPTLGRRRWDIVSEISGTTLTLEVQGVDYHVAEADATVTEITTTLDNQDPFTAGDYKKEYEGAPFDEIRLILTAASSLAHKTKIRTYDY